MAFSLSSILTPALLFLTSFLLATRTNCCNTWALCPLLAGIFHLCQSVYRSLKIESMKGRGVMITGCDTGFGHQLAIDLHFMGATVFAACLDDNSEGAQKLKTTGVHVLKMDVTNDEQVEKGKRYVEDNLPSLGLWALVNNAGLGIFGYIEWASLKSFERAASVNLFGGIRVTKAFAPMIRKSRGRIVNVSSVMGRSIIPWTAPYTLTKVGISAFTDILRLEMKSFGVSVCCVEPGNFLAITGIVNGKGGVASDTEKLWESLDSDLKESYGTQKKKNVIRLGRLLETTGFKNTRPVLEAMTDAICRLYPKDHYFVASFQDKLVSALYFLLPSYLYDMFIHATLNKY